METRRQRELGADIAAHLHRLYAERGRQGRFTGGGKAAFLAWQAQAGKELAAALGGQPASVPPLQLERIPIPSPEAPEFAGVRLERLYYATREDLAATAYLVLPEALPAPAPAVLCPPGHGGGINQVVFDQSGIYHQYPLALARQGLVALVPEHLGSGERVEEQGCTHLFCYLALVLLGESAMGYLAWDLRRALDVLEALPEVDAGRLGCYGLSLGGEMTLLTTALDQRIKAACVSGFFTSYRSTYLHEQHCGCGYVPRLACKLEHVDIAALIAPRPLLVEAGTEDPSFRPEAARAGVEELRGYYGLLGAQQRLAFHVFEGKHEISGAQAFPWLARWLSG